MNNDHNPTVLNRRYEANNLYVELRYTPTHDSYVIRYGLIKPTYDHPYGHLITTHLYRANYYFDDLTHFIRAINKECHKVDRIV